MCTWLTSAKEHAPFGWHHEETALQPGERAMALTRDQQVTSSKRLRVETVDGDRLVLTSDESGGAWEVGRLPHTRVVWHGSGKALVMEGTRALFVASLE